MSASQDGSEIKEEGWQELDDEKLIDEVKEIKEEKEGGRQKETCKTDKKGMKQNSHI